MARKGSSGVAGERSWGDRPEYDAARPSAACWVKFFALSGTQNFFNRGFGTSSGGQWALRASPSAIVLVARLKTAAVSATVPSTNVWYHVGFRHRDDTSNNFQLFINGSLEASTYNDNSGFAAGANSIVATLRSSGQYCAIAEAAVWNTPLSDDEFAILGAGFSPDSVRPESLVLYDPMLSGSVAYNAWESTAATDTETGTVSDEDHPPIIYPDGVLDVVQGSGTPPGSILTPYYYQNLLAGAA